MKFLNFHTCSIHKSYLSDIFFRDDQYSYPHTEPKKKKANLQKLGPRTKKIKTKPTLYSAISQPRFPKHKMQEKFCEIKYSIINIEMQLKLKGKILAKII